MTSRLVDEIGGLSCPLCSDRTGLVLVLRLEVEAERQVIIAACPTCHRLYQARPGAYAVEPIEWSALTCQVVRCPRCGSQGNVVSYAMSETSDAESHRVLTCGVCEHTFCPDRSQPRDSV